MSHEIITPALYKILNPIYEHESTQFFTEQRIFAKDYRATHDDAMPDSTFWNYLTYKHNLDPHRFDHYHPIVGRWIEEATSSCYSTTSCTQLPHIDPAPRPVPEPQSLALLGIGIMLLVVYRKLF
jgi:PEP-CTERM motif